MSDKLKNALDEAAKKKKEDKKNGKGKMLSELHALDDKIEDFIQKLEKKIDAVKDNPIFVKKAFQLLADMSKEYSEFIAALRAIVNAIDRKGMTLPKENPIGKVRDVNSRKTNPEDEFGQPPPEEGGEPPQESVPPKGVKEALTLEPKKCKQNESIREALNEKDKFTSKTAKNLKVNDIINKVGQIQSISKQNHLIIVHTLGKKGMIVKKIYDEKESVTIVDL